jgi:hypothetical protein
LLKSMWLPEDKDVPEDEDEEEESLSILTL